MSSSKFFDAENKIWSGPIRPCLYNTNISAGYVMLNALKNTPDRVMQVCDDTGVELTCSEIYKRSIIIAKYLSEKINLKECEIVGFMVDNSENVTSCVLACLSMGFPLNPLATVMAESDIIFMYSMSKPRVIFCDGNLADKIKKAIKKIEIECLVITVDEKLEGVEFVGEILEKFDGDVNDFE
jgi:acyl-CoA synthetase (AMP-forming)/AMP-acid ligase II